MFRRLRRIAQFRYAMRQAEDSAETSDVRAALRWLRKSSQDETLIAEMAECQYEDVQGEGYRGDWMDFITFVLSMLETWLPIILAMFAKKNAVKSAATESGGITLEGATPAPATPKANKRK